MVEPETSHYSITQMAYWRLVSHSRIFGRICAYSVTVTNKFKTVLCSKNPVCLRLLGKSPCFPLQHVTIFGAQLAGSPTNDLSRRFFQLVLLWFFCCVQTVLIVNLFMLFKSVEFHGKVHQKSADKSVAIRGPGSWPNFPPPPVCDLSSCSAVQWLESVLVINRKDEYTFDVTSYLLLSIEIWGRDSSVGIATRYELEDPGIESQWKRIIPHPSRPVLDLTQPPIQWIPGLFRSKAAGACR